MESRQLLEKFLAGIYTRDELRQVNTLLDTEAGRDMLDELIEQGERHKLTRPLPTDAVRRELVLAKSSEMRQRIAAYQRSRRTLRSRKMAISRVAAVFSGVLLVAGALFWRGGDSAAVEYAELSNPGGVPVLHELSDGSQVWLAAGSTLKYPADFHDKGRSVELSGEAFFDVARDESRPFTIRTGAMETRVLGTSFKITAFEGHEHEVSVATGKVSVSRKGKELALLTRGASVRHNPATGETNRIVIDPAGLESWKSGTMTFDELSIGLIARQLEARYGIEVEFADPAVAWRKVSGTVRPEEGIDKIMGMLGFVGKFQYSNLDDKHYTIY